MYVHSMFRDLRFEVEMILILLFGMHIAIKYCLKFNNIICRVIHVVHNCHSITCLYVQSDNIPCPYNGDFRCAYGGGCVRGYDVCDGNEECPDGSDEGLNC